MRPSVSIVVSGFAVREASWDRLRSCLDSIARQDSGPLEVVLVERAGLAGEISLEIRDAVPGMRFVDCANPDPWARKTAGARVAQAPLIAFVDGDCLLQPGWLAALLETFHYYPEVAVLKGTAEAAWWERMLTPRSGGPVRSSAANNVAFRREAYLDCPFPEGSGARAVALQSAALRRAHYVLWAEPAMRVIRDRRGLAQAVRALADYSTATTR
jgi:glycosyltransferase involved in cell wall biosynthesis